MIENLDFWIFDIIIELGTRLEGQIMVVGRLKEHLVVII